MFFFVKLILIHEESRNILPAFTFTLTSLIQSNLSEKMQISYFEQASYIISFQLEKKNPSILYKAF